MVKTLARGLGLCLPLVVAASCESSDAPSSPVAGDATADVVRADGTPANDANTSADGAAGLDASREADASQDADASVPPALYATHDGKLVTLNLTTGAETLVGAISPEPYRLAFDGTKLYGLVVEAGPTYRLVTVNPCTAGVTLGPTLSVATGAMTLPEGLAYSTGDNALFVSLSRNGADNLSEGLARVDTTTGALTDIGNASSDHDVLTAYQGGLLSVDATLVTTVWSTAYATVNAQTGGAAAAGVPSTNAQMTGLAQHPTTSVLYGWVFEGADPFKLVTLDLASGGVTPIGVTHTGSAIGGFAFATVRCP